MRYFAWTCAAGFIVLYLALVSAHEDLVAAIRKKLARGNLSVRAAATRSGLPVRSVQGVLEGHVPSVNRAAEIAAALGLEFYVGPRRGELEPVETPPPPWKELREGFREDFQDLREDMAELLRQAETARQAEDLTDDEALVDPSGLLRYIDGLDELAAAAGAGAMVFDETVTSRIPFRRDWLQRHDLQAAQCKIIRVRGESMEPTLPDGCSILVDRKRRRRRAGHVFVLITGDGLVVKRLDKDDNGWQLTSDHPAWKPVAWTDDTQIIGQVRWMAKTL